MALSLHLSLANRTRSRKLSVRVIRRVLASEIGRAWQHLYPRVNAVELIELLADM